MAKVKEICRLGLDAVCIGRNLPHLKSLFIAIVKTSGHLRRHTQKKKIRPYLREQPDFPERIPNVLQVQ